MTIRAVVFKHLKHNSAEVHEYLREMRTEVRSDLSSINNKIDDINISMNQLKAENESLKKENKRLWSEIDIIKKKADKLEGHSRRNNIRIIGIEGSLNESWNETERKVRDFITSDLNMPDMEHVEIERAHRMQSRYENKSSVIVKFSRFKDKETILNQARQVLHNESTRRVHEDFTDRVKLHRREPGKRLVHARENGQYASMNNYKLIIENTVYGYVEEKKDSYIIGHARGNPGTKFHQRRRRVITGDGYQQTDDGQETQTVPWVLGPAQITDPVTTYKHINILTWNIAGLNKHRQDISLINYLNDYWFIRNMGQL